MYLPKNNINLNDVFDTTGVVAKPKDPATFGKEMGVGLPKIKKEETNEAANKLKAENDEKLRLEAEAKAKAEKEATAATTTATETELDEDARKAAEWLLSDEEPESPQTVVKTVEEPETPAVVIPDDILQKAEKYEQLTSSEVFKLVDAFAASGEKNINKFVSQIAGDDISGKTFEEIYEMNLLSLGVSDESRQRLLEKFADKDIEDQELEIIPIKQKMNAERDEKISKFLSTYQSVAGTKQENNIDPQEAARVDALVKQGIQDTEALVSDLVGKKWNGLLFVTPEMAEEIKQNILIDPCPIVKDGKVVGYDLKTATRVAIAKNEKYFKTLLKTGSEISRTQGWDEFVEKRNKPSKENTATPQTPVQKTKSQSIKEGSEKAFGGVSSAPKFD